MKIAVVDDSPRDLQLIKGYVERYFKEKGGDYQVWTFENGLDFLDEEKLSFDIVFMDVELKQPGISGKGIRWRYWSLLPIWPSTPSMAMRWMPLSTW